MTEKGRSLLKQEGISMKVGFIGLGRMGQAMARRLLEAKHDVGVYNRTPEKIKDIVADGAKSLNSIEQACRYGAAVFSMLADDAALAEVSEQNGGLLQSLPKGGIHICSGTHGVAIVKKLTAAHKEREQILVSAPVLARPEMVASGQAAVVIGGPEDALARCKPLFDAIGRRTFEA
ncbi:MAG: NAD(P)-binding domain-containing protein, partial [Pseudolabrys sp.]